MAEPLLPRSRADEEAREHAPLGEEPDVLPEADPTAASTDLRAGDDPAFRTPEPHARLHPDELRDELKD